MIYHFRTKLKKQQKNKKKAQAKVRLKAKVTVQAKVKAKAKAKQKAKAKLPSQLRFEITCHIILLDRVFYFVCNMMQSFEIYILYCIKILLLLYFKLC